VRGVPHLYGHAVRRVTALEARRLFQPRLAKAVQRARIDAEIAVSELAAAIGVGDKTIHAWEAARIGIPAFRLYQIAGALGLPIDSLLPDGP
jgi:transcriptional regulator with XRE-family HTH domain